MDFILLIYYTDLGNLWFVSAMYTICLTKEVDVEAKLLHQTDAPIFKLLLTGLDYYNVA